MIRTALAVALALLAGACAHPLAGRIWHPASGTFVDAETVFAHAARTRHVLIGEVHDNPDHHRFQLEALQALSRAGRPRALAMEQFDTEHQAALDAAPAEAEALAAAGRFDRRGWDWPQYRPLVAFAAEHRWPLLAANLSRAQIRGAPPVSATPQVRSGLERDMIDGHCGHRPGAAAMAAMVNAQLARDARMAGVLAQALPEGTVLIAGNGHVRRDRGAPLFLDASQALVVGQLEVEPGRDSPADYLRPDGFASLQSFDYVHFSARAPREDPCAGFRGMAPPGR